jgi:hypothetical protein
MAGTSASPSTLPKPSIASEKISVTNVSLIVAFALFHSMIHFGPLAALPSLLPK